MGAALSLCLLIAVLSPSCKSQLSSSDSSKKSRSTNRRKGSRRVIQPLPLPQLDNFYMKKQNGVTGGVYLNHYQDLGERASTSDSGHISSLHRNQLISSKSIPDHWYPNVYKGSSSVTLSRAVKNVYNDRKILDSNNSIVINYKEKRRYRFIVDSYERKNSNRIKICTQESIARSQKSSFQDNIDYVLKEKAMIGDNAIVVWTILDEVYKDMIIEAQSMIRTKLGGSVYSSFFNRNVHKNNTGNNPHLASLTLHKVPILLVFVSLSSEVTEEACLNDAIVVTYPYKKEDRKIAETKFGFSYQLAKNGIDGLFFELDLFIFRDFRHHIRRDSDLTICSHQNSYVINIGLFYVKASKRTSAVFAFLVDIIAANKKFDQQTFNKAVECILYRASDSCKNFARTDGSMPLLPSEIVITNIASNVIVSGFPRNRMIDSYQNPNYDGINIAGFHILSLSPLKGAHGKINVAKEATFYEGANQYYTNDRKKYLAYDGNLIVSNSVENYGKNHNFETHLRLYILIAMLTNRVAIMPRWLLKDAETILPYEYIDTKFLDKYVEWRESSFFNNRKTSIKGPCAQLQVKSYQSSYKTKINGSVVIRRHMGVDCSMSQDIEVYNIDMKNLGERGEEEIIPIVFTTCDFLQLILSIFEDSSSSSSSSNINKDNKSLKDFPIIFLKILDPYVDILHSYSTLSDWDKCKNRYRLDDSLLPFMTEVVNDLSTQHRVGRICTDFTEKGISYHEMNCYDDCQNRKSNWGFNDYDKIDK